VRKPIQPHTFYARLLVFDESLAKPDFAVVNCSDVVMSLFYFTSLFQRAARHFAVLNCCVITLIVFSFDVLTWSADSAMAHEIRRLRVEEYTYVSTTSPKRWFGKMNMTFNCDVTNSENEIEMTTISY